MIRISVCPACGSKNNTALLSCVDHTVSHETFAIRQCETCALGITTPRPEEENIEKYYQSDQYISHSGKTSGIGLLYKMIRSYSLKRKERLLRKYSKPGKALDYGCGTGEFVSTLKRRGWNPYGIEPSSVARKKALILNKENVYQNLNEINQNSFDVITMWHVLEHIPDIKITLTNIKSHLSTTGTLFIAVPNYHALDAQHYKAYWAGYDVPRHLWHFTKNSMQTLLATHGLKIVDIVPMKFDSYYVSMLSEQYKNNNRFTPGTFLRGIITGLRSNMQARQTINYSSLIYVVKTS